MRKKLLILFSVIVVCVMFIVLGGSLSTDSVSAQEDKAPQIYIGVISPLSGYNAVSGNLESLGLEYANTVKPTVSIGGVAHEVQLVVVDSQSESAAASGAAAQLAGQQVTAVIASFGDSVTGSVAETFSNASIPSVAISNSEISAVSGVYRTACFSESFQGGTVANFVSGKGWTRAAVVSQVGDSYSKGLAARFTDEFVKLGGEVESFSFNSVQQNFEDLIEQISDSGADCVFMPSAASSASVFISQARENGFTVPIIGSDSWDTGALISSLGTAGREVYISSPFSEDDSGNVDGASFAAKFKTWVSAEDERIERNGGGSYTSPITARAYGAYMSLCAAIERADTANSAELFVYLADNGGLKAETSSGCAYIKSVSVTGKRFELVQTYLEKK